MRSPLATTAAPRVRPHAALFWDSMPPLDGILSGLGSINFDAFMEYPASLGNGEEEKRHGKGDEGETRRRLKNA